MERNILKKELETFANKFLHEGEIEKNKLLINHMNDTIKKIIENRKSQKDKVDKVFTYYLLSENKEEAIDLSQSETLEFQEKVREMIMQSTTKSKFNLQLKDVDTQLINLNTKILEKKDYLHNQLSTLFQIDQLIPSCLSQSIIKEKFSFNNTKLSVSEDGIVLYELQFSYGNLLTNIISQQINLKKFIELIKEDLPKNNNLFSTIISNNTPSFIKIKNNFFTKKNPTNLIITDEFLIDEILIDPHSNFISAFMDIQIKKKDIKNNINLNFNKNSSNNISSININFENSVTKNFNEYGYIYILILSTYLNQIKNESIKNINSFITENKKIISLIDTIYPIAEEKDPLLKTYTNSQDDNERLKKRLIHLERCVKNIKNLYAKKLGLELTTSLEELNLITIEKKFTSTKSQFTTNIASLNFNWWDMTNHLKFPEFYIPPLEGEYIDGIFHQQNVQEQNVFKSQNKKLGNFLITDFINIKNNINSIKSHHAQEFILKDQDTWHKLADLQINQKFTSFFITTLSQIITKTQLNSDLNESEYEFLNSFYNINLNIFNNYPKLKKQVLNHACNFKDLSPFLFTNDEEIQSKNFLGKLSASNKNLKKLDEDLNIRYIKKCLDRIFAKKFEFITLFFGLNIFLRANKFELLIFFCSRGRGYPVATILQHILTLSRLFIQFKNTPNNIKKREEQFLIFCKHLFSPEIFKKIKSLLDKLKLNKNANNLSLQSTFDIMKLYNIKKISIFSFWQYACDYLNMNDVCYNMMTRAKWDACSSGSQILAMLIQNKKLAKDIGLIGDENFQDIYSKIIKSILHQITNINNINKNFENLNNIDTENIEYVDTKNIESISTNFEYPENLNTMKLTINFLNEYLENPRKINFLHKTTLGNNFINEIIGIHNMESLALIPLFNTNNINNNNYYYEKHVNRCKYFKKKYLDPIEFNNVFLNANLKLNFILQKNITRNFSPLYSEEFFSNGLEKIIFSELSKKTNISIITLKKNLMLVAIINIFLIFYMIFIL